MMLRDETRVAVLHSVDGSTRVTLVDTSNELELPTQPVLLNDTPPIWSTATTTGLLLAWPRRLAIVSHSGELSELRVPAGAHIARQNITAIDHPDEIAATVLFGAGEHVWRTSVRTRDGRMSMDESVGTWSDDDGASFAWIAQLAQPPTTAPTSRSEVAVVEGDKAALLVNSGRKLIEWLRFSNNEPAATRLDLPTTRDETAAWFVDDKRTIFVQLVEAEPADRAQSTDRLQRAVLFSTKSGGKWRDRQVDVPGRPLQILPVDNDLTISASDAGRSSVLLICRSGATLVKLP
jgi:hypothetical protein